MQGKLIVFEGVEGCGKSTQMQICCEWLQSLDIPVLVTREPGGTVLGADIRRLLLEKSDDKPITSTTELLLYAADRSQHVEQELRPNLAAGKIILCDRYTYSTVAYQGYGRSLDMNLINQLNVIATGGLEPDLGLWLDLDVEVGFARKRGSGDIADRIEQEKIDFHHRVQLGYSKLAASKPGVIFRVDGSLTREKVTQKIQEILNPKLEVWGYTNPVET